MRVLKVCRVLQFWRLGGHRSYTTQTLSAIRKRPSAIRNRHSAICNRHSAICHRHSAIRNRCSAIRHRHSAICNRHSAIRYRHSAIRNRCCAIRHRPSAICNRHSAIRYRHSAIRNRCCAIRYRPSSSRNRWIPTDSTLFEPPAFVQLWGFCQLHSCRENCPRNKLKGNYHRSRVPCGAPKCALNLRYLVKLWSRMLWIIKSIYRQRLSEKSIFYHNFGQA